MEHLSRWQGRKPPLFYIVHMYLYGVIRVMLFPQGTSIPALYPVLARRDGDSISNVLLHGDSRQLL